MKYLKIGIKTTVQAEELVSNLFLEAGFEGVQIEDFIPITQEEKEAMYIDILPELPEDDTTAFLSSYSKPDKNADEMVQFLKKGLEEIKAFVDIGEGIITKEEVNDEEWIDNWKAFFKPFRVAEDIIINPSWEKLEEKNDADMVIEMDPGTAFGTGSHETTRLCITSMKKYMTKDISVLDVGCGSGILSIIALKLGAKSATLTDIDKAAVTAAYENLERNGIDKKQYQILEGNLIEEKELQEKAGFLQYDMVMANILADVIIPLSGVIGKHMKQNSIFIVSGILNTKKEAVKDALQKNGFVLMDTLELGDWVSFTARKKDIMC